MNRSINQIRIQKSHQLHVVSILFPELAPLLFCWFLLPPFFNSSPKSLKSIRPFSSLVSHFTLAFWPEAKLPNSSSSFFCVVVVWREIPLNPPWGFGWVGAESEIPWPHDCCCGNWSKFYFYKLLWGCWYCCCPNPMFILSPIPIWPCMMGCW